MAIELIKIKSEIGAGTRGSSTGIDAMEIAAINKNNDYFNQFDVVEVADENKSLYSDIDTPSAKRIEAMVKVYERMTEAVSTSINNHKFPIVLAGDHASAGGTISGIKKANPDKRLGVVWIDAHADIHSPYTSPSGNIHGMPVSTAIGENNLDRKINRPNEKTIAYWEQLQNMGAPSPKVLPSDVVYFGVRDTEEPEDYIIHKHGIKNYRVEELRYRGLDVCVNEAIKSLNDCDIIYISFDVDSMDCDLISKGTGTPVSRGFDQQEVQNIMMAFIETGKVATLEFVEVNPLLDEKGNKMAETAFDVLKELTKTIVHQLNKN